jgi:hypothetical protein
LKKLYVTLQEWANEWEGFKYDSESFIRMDDNIWTIFCVRRYKDRRGQNHFHTTREMMKNNIFF